MTADIVMTSPAFDYSVLDPQVADEARHLSEVIRERNRSAIFETGRDLKAIKERLGHGHFLKWIDAEFSMSERTAQNYISAFDVLGEKSATVAGLPAKTVYRLAARSTPAAARARIVSRLEGGEVIAPEEVGRLIKVAQDNIRYKRAEERRERTWDRLTDEEREKFTLEKRHRAKQEAQRQADIEAFKRKREADARKREERTRELAQLLLDCLGPEVGRFCALLNKCYVPDLMRHLAAARKKAGG